MDFGALPPEVNSAFMYVGAGAAPLLTAAAAWNGIAAELSTAASSYDSVITRLSTEQWLGPASLSMVAAAQPLMIWLTYTAESAALAAAQAMASVAAFETAFAMTVPPAEVAANRAQLAALVATNIFGQNGPTIAAAEARYGEMWAQDAWAMYSYAASSAAAGRLNPLTSPLQITNPAETVASDSALRVSLSNLIENGPDAVLRLASPAMSEVSETGEDTLELIAAFDEAEIPMYDVFHHCRAILADWGANLFTTWLPAGAGTGAGDASGAALGVAPAAGLARPVSSAAVGGPPLFAGSGNAVSVGRLSVPANWSTAVPSTTAAVTVADGTGWAVPAEDGPIAAMPPAPGMAVPEDHAGVGAGPRYGFTPIVMPNRKLF